MKKIILFSFVLLLFGFLLPSTAIALFGCLTWQCVDSFCSGSTFVDENTCSYLSRTCPTDIIQITWNQPIPYNSETEVKTVCRPDNYLLISGQVSVKTCDNQQEGEIDLHIQIGDSPTGPWTTITIIDAAVDPGGTRAFQELLTLPENTGTGIKYIRLYSNVRLFTKYCYLYDIMDGGSKCCGVDWNEIDSYVRAIKVSDCLCASGYSEAAGICAKPEITEKDLDTDCPEGYSGAIGICAKADITGADTNLDVDCPEGYSGAAGICAKADITDVPQTRPVNLVVDREYCHNGLPGFGLASFKWTYMGSESQTKYDLQISENSTFTSLVINSLNNLDPVSSGTTRVQSFWVRQDPDVRELAYNKTYWWRVKVYSENKESNWVYPENTATIPGTPFQTPPRTHPHPEFLPLIEDPANPLTVTFQDLSWCPVATCDYGWSFGDGGISITSGTVSHDYSGPGEYTVSLTLCDSGRCCTYSGSLDLISPPLGGRLPRWKEVSPFGP